MREFLEPTSIIDSDHPDIVAKARELTAGLSDDISRAIALYYFSRDSVFYNPYVESFPEEIFRASHTLKAKRSFCIPKAILLAALARAVGIPARLGFADVKNHLTSEKLQAALRSEVVAFHGYTELYLEGKWVKATPAFNKKLCQAFHIHPLDFNGREDSIFHPFSTDGRKHMEYIREYGTFADMPFEEMMNAYRRQYPHWFQNGFLIDFKNASFEKDAAAETAAGSERN